jgi:hypothetical protein
MPPDLSAPTGMAASYSLLPTAEFAIVKQGVLLTAFISS